MTQTRTIRFSVLLASLLATILAVTAAATFGLGSKAYADQTWGQEVHRFYNPEKSDHLYTTDPSECNNVRAAGWQDEGVCWVAPVTSNNPVYRLYNPVLGTHMYTMNNREYQDLKNYYGWTDEGIGFYSDDACKPECEVYRYYNAGIASGAHFFITSDDERQFVEANDWNDEGVGFYALAIPATGSPAEPTPPVVEPTPPVTDPVEPTPPTGDGWWEVVDFAKQYLGWPYVYAGESPEEGGFDCSGLTYFVYSHFGYELPRTTYDQIAYLQNKGSWHTDINELKPGDLIAMDGGGHVGIYAGVDPETGRHMMVDAGATDSAVVYREIYSIYWSDTFMGGGSVR